MGSSRHLILAASLVLSAVLPAAGQSEGPLSAIDWLSDSVATPAAVPLPGTPGGPSDIATNALPAAVATMPLDQALPDAIGLITSAEAGLPAELWGASPAADIAARLRAEPIEMLPSQSALMRAVLLAELSPPVDASQDTSLFLARIDRLLELGMLSEAAALLDEAESRDPEIFRRTFDVALLTGQENRGCEVMRVTPEISPTYPARIFCLARNGDWQAAALTLETANALNLLDEDLDHLLARFLDPELFEGQEAPRPPHAPSPLVYRLYEAIGEPLASTGLPIAFAHADLRPTSGWKARLTAAERLAATGALGSRALFALYRERKPAASGGVWERAAAVQALDRALDERDAAEVALRLPTAWEAMQAAQLEAPFAEEYGAQLTGLSLPAEAGSLAFRIGLLSPGYETIAQDHRPASPDERFLMALARGLPAYAPTSAPLPLAVRRGFDASNLPPRYQALVDDDRLGEAVLYAIQQFSEGAFGDYDQISDALAFFRLAGLETVARRGAIELLVLERRG